MNARRGWMFVDSLKHYRDRSKVLAAGASFLMDPMEAISLNFVGYEDPLEALLNGRGDTVALALFHAPWWDVEGSGAIAASRIVVEGVFDGREAVRTAMCRAALSLSDRWEGGMPASVALLLRSASGDWEPSSSELLAYSAREGETPGSLAREVALTAMRACRATCAQPVARYGFLTALRAGVEPSAASAVLLDELTIAEGASSLRAANGGAA
jgi:hypothetical protein